MTDNSAILGLIGPNENAPNEANPCLLRLAQTLKLKDGVQIPLEKFRFSSPLARNCERSMFCLANTEVAVWTVDNPAKVHLTYNRRSLDTLQHNYGPVVIGFTPKTFAYGTRSPDDQLAAIDSLERLLQAVSVHYGRTIGLADVQIDSLDTLVQSPDGKWSMRLRANEDSYGWTGEYMVVFVVQSDLSKAAVKALDGFTYIRPPRPTDPDLTTGDTTMDGFVYAMPIDLSKADVTALPPFGY